MVSKTEPVCNAINPLEFWPGEGSSFPILAGVAARVLPTPPTSASDEQLFSVGGRIVTDERLARLNLRLELNDPEVIESDEDDEDDNGNDGDD